MGWLVHFYRFWHGALHLKGAGWLLRKAARYSTTLQEYPLAVNGIGTARLDFRESQSFALLNLELGESHLTHLIDALRPYLKGGSVVWDVGANVGAFTLVLLRSGASVRSVAAFEPHPVAYRTLHSLYERSAVVKTIPAALGPRRGSMMLHLAAGDSSVSSLCPGRDGDGVKVEVYAGDEVPAAFAVESPDVIKIDVEGYEPSVLEGMTRIIAAKRPVVLFEHLFLSDEALRKLVPPAYDLLFLLGDGRITPDWAFRSRSGDALLVPRRADS